MGFDDVDLVEGQPEPVAHVADADHHGRPRSGSESQPQRGLASSDAERMDLEGRPAARNGGTHLEHVGAENHLLSRHEVVRVVLHEARAAGLTAAIALVVRSMTEVFQSPTPPNP
ncbi:hypothetical protein ASG95_20435 [Phycicoccus sp. Soil803]|nr:hypothetical protein ASG95_20435 [Phycicoccus sp. Soil803]